jgi:hypothetical protein
MPSIRWRWGGLLLLAGLLCTGCGGDDGPPRYGVSGTVTFQGQPVPAGVVLFTPDNTKGNEGPTGFAPIRAGKYDTSLEDGDGKGTIGGPHKVTISGFDGVAAPEQELPDGKRLFADYVVDVDLPKEPTTTQNFDVPASAARAGSRPALPPGAS